MDKNDRDSAVLAQTEYERGNCKECLRLLDSMSESKGRLLNRALAKFGIDKDVNCLLKHLRATEDLEPNQQVLVDYNRALALSKFKGDFEEAIDLLENRKAVLPESSGVIDDRLVTQVTLLLAVLYIESRKDPQRALNLLQSLSEKADLELCPTEKMQQLKAKCYLQIGSSKTAKKELKSISGAPSVRACLELQRGNCKKAFKIHSSCPDEESQLFRNNESLILFGSGKRTHAVFKLGCLLKPSMKSLPPEIIYNLAVMQLFTGNCQHSRKLLAKLIPHFRFNPRLWLRFGETILQDQTRNFLFEVDLNRHKHDLVIGYFGEGNHRKLLMKPYLGKQLDTEAILFAKSCFLNGLNCFHSKELSFSPSNMSSEQEIARLKISLLLSLSFTHLSLDDYPTALSFARCANSLSPKGYQKCLTNLYTGEALLLLDRVSEAVHHFNPNFATEEPQQVNSSSEESVPPLDFISSWYPNTARVTLLYNLALAHAMKGDYDRATESLKQIGSNATSDTTMPIHVIMLSAYMQLQQGYIEGAKALIRQHLPHLR